jgi:sugar phosphate isomerase/epimerase
MMPMTRLAFSTNAFKQNTLAEAVDAIAGAGYAGVELMADVPHAHPARFDAAQRAALQRQLAGRGLVVSNVNAFTHFADGDTYHPTWIEHDPARRQVRIDHTIGAIELAAEFGTATVSVQPGGPLIGTGLTRGQASERFAAGLRQVLPRARALGVVIAVEPEPGLLIETAAEYAAFVAEHFADEPLVRMNCDVGHLFCVGDDPAAVIRDQPGQVAHVHLEDIGANRVHQHLLPGKGVIDFPAVFAALDAIGYRGWVTVELYPFEATAAEVARRAMEHLRPMIG